jgi:hypothetical protein
MPLTSDVVWQPSGAKRPVLRWVIAAAAIVTVIAWFNGGATREPDMKGPDATSRATQAAVPVRRPRAPSTVEPVRILNPAAQPAPRAQPDERINDVAARSLLARREPADYQALRREMLATD